MSTVPTRPDADQASDGQPPAYDPADPWLSIWLLVTDISERLDQLAAMLDQTGPASPYARFRRLLTQAIAATVALIVCLVAALVTLAIIRPGGL